MVLGKLPVPGRPTNWMIVGQGPIAQVGAGGAVWTFLLSSIFSLLFLPLYGRRLDIGGGRVVRWCWANFQCRDVLLIWMRVGQVPSVLSVGTGWGRLDIFSLVSHFSFFLPLSGRRLVGWLIWA